MPCPNHPLYDSSRGKPRGENADCRNCQRLWTLRLRRNRWKRRERQVAKKVGSFRNPGSGSPENPGDVNIHRGIARWFAVIEHRDRKTWSVPAWIREVAAEAEKTKTGKPWLLTLSHPGERGIYVVMDYDAFINLINAEAGDPESTQ